VDRIGAVGSIIVGMLIYSEPTDPGSNLCLTLIVRDDGPSSIRPCEMRITADAPEQDDFSSNRIGSIFLFGA